MTADDAMAIAAKEGVFRAPFYGEVVIRVKDGSVTAVDVKKTFVETPK